MLAEHSHTKIGSSVPQSNRALSSARGIHVERVVCYFLGLVYEAPLVDDVALRLPLPNYHLAQRFNTQSQPSARLIHSQAAYLMLTHCECLNLLQLLTHQFPNTELAIAVCTSQKPCFWLKDSSSQKTTLAYSYLLCYYVSSSSHFPLELREVFLFRKLLFVNLVSSGIISGSLL